MLIYFFTLLSHSCRQRRERGESEPTNSSDEDQLSIDETDGGPTMTSTAKRWVLVSKQIMITQTKTEKKFFLLNMGKSWLNYKQRSNSNILPQKQGKFQE